MFSKAHNIHKLDQLDPTWDQLGLFEAILDHLGGILGLFLGQLGAILGCLKPSWTILGDLGTYFGPTWGYLGLLEAILEACWIQESPR